MRRSRRRAAVTAAILFLASIVSGCWDRWEIEDLAYVLAVGFDRGPENKLVVTYQIAKPREATAKQGGGGGATFVTVSVTAPSAVGAANLANAFMARRITLEHARVIMIGEDLAREGIEPMLVATTRYREFRRFVLLAVARGRTAKETLEGQVPTMELNVGKWYDLMAAHQQYTGLVRASRLHDVAIRNENLGCAPVMLTIGLNADQSTEGRSGESGSGALAGQLEREGGDLAEELGVAYFRQAKLAGFLNGDETRLLLLVSGDVRRFVDAVPDPRVPGEVNTFEIRPARNPVFRVSWHEGRPVIDLRLRLEGDLIGVGEPGESLIPDHIDLLEKSVVDHYKPRLEALIARTQRDRADIFCFGNAARKTVWTWPQWERMNWPERYPDATVNVSIEFELRRFGQQLSLPPDPTNEGEGR